MDTVVLIGVIVVLAILLWLVPMDEIFKKIIYVVAIVCVIVWLLGVIGVWSPHLNLR